MAMPQYDKLIFELSSPGRIAFSLPEPDVPVTDLRTLIPPRYLRQRPAELPEVSEVDVVRHYSRLSQLNYGVDTHFYPLGSCTMKYNPKVNEDMARLPGFARLHPLAPERAIQGALRLMHDLAADLGEIAGMDAVTLQPAAGAQGELAGVLMIRAYHLARGERRTKVLVPDSAHGTNPASTAIAGFQIVELKSERTGEVDLLDLERHLDAETAAFMITLPNTLGLFETRITEIIERCHAKGAQVYMDGANLNAILGLLRPGDLGFDVCHFNLHKTFTTPHGGGGPGAGPVGVKAHLAPFLPVPVVAKRPDGAYGLDWRRPQSIGKCQAFWGNFGMLVRAYAYIRTMGAAGLRSVAENAVLNANYVMKRLEPYYDLGAPGPCMHECVLSARRQKQQAGITATDIAKRLLDLGFYAPSTYFPLIVEEALMIEPTETESKETLDAFCEAMIQIAKETEKSPDILREAPVTTAVRRLDQTRAARQPNLRWRPSRDAAGP
jgi:glycine cleavage system P protein (glycine dehydrogenase) subunit 2